MRRCYKLHLNRVSVRSVAIVLCALYSSVSTMTTASVATAETGGAASHSAAEGASAGRGQSGSTASSDNSLRETKVELADDLLAAIGRSPAKGGRSSYDDLPASSPNWGYVRLALQYGLVRPDTKHHYGAVDPVTDADVAYAMARLYGVPVTATFTPLDWATTVGIMPQSDSTGNVTHEQVVAVLNNMVAWADVQKWFPHSWTLTAAEGQALQSAINSAQSATEFQLTRTHTQSLTVSLTAKGLAVPQYRTLETGLSLPNQTTTSIQAETSVGGTTAVISSTVTSSSNAATGQLATASTKYYVAGGQVFESTGKGWTTALLPKTTLASLQSVTEDLPLAGLSGVTVRPTSASKTGAATGQSATVTYVGGFLPADLVTYVQRALKSSGLSPTGAIVSTFLRAASVQVLLTVDRTSHRLVNESVELAVHVPPKTIGAWLGKSWPVSEQTAFNADVSAVTDSVADTYTIAYPTTPIALPKALASSQSGS